MNHTVSHDNWSAELAVAEALAREAGALVQGYRQAGLAIQHKTGADDPVTAADHAASALLMRDLAAAFPDDGLLSEEEADSAARLAAKRVWLIDPIDGTKEYASLTSPDYCVSVGLVVDGEPVLGVIYAPDTDELFSGAVGLGVRKNGVPVPLRNAQPYVIATSVTEDERELHAVPLVGMQPSGSTALKLARIAAGEADVTFTMSPRAEWDLAAGHALLRAQRQEQGPTQGADLVRRDGTAVRYNQPKPYLEQGFMAGHFPALAWLQAELLRLGVPNAVLSLEADAQGQRRHSRCIAGKEVAWLVVVGGEVLHTGGDAFHLERLLRDVRRAGDSLK